MFINNYLTIFNIAKRIVKSLISLYILNTEKDKLFEN